MHYGLGREDMKDGDVKEFPKSNQDIVNTERNTTTRQAQENVVSTDNGSRLKSLRNEKKLMNDITSILMGEKQSMISRQRTYKQVRKRIKFWKKIEKSLRNIESELFTQKIKQIKSSKFERPNTEQIITTPTNENSSIADDGKDEKSLVTSSIIDEDAMSEILFSENDQKNEELSRADIIKKIRQGKGKRFLTFSDDEESSISNTLNELQMDTIDRICPICTDTVNDIMGVPTTCEHEFCGNCLIIWAQSLIKHSSNITCPTCRVRISGIRLGLHDPRRDSAFVSVESLENGDGTIACAEDLIKYNKNTILLLPEEIDRSVSIISEDEDEKCGLCNVQDDEEKLICDYCNSVFHMFCVGLRPPPYHNIPEGYWFCHGCWGRDGMKIVEQRAPILSEQELNKFKKTIKRDRLEYLNLKNAEQARLRMERITLCDKNRRPHRIRHY